MEQGRALGGGSHSLVLKRLRRTRRVSTRLGWCVSAPSVKQHLACIRMLFDWLVTLRVVPVNPAHSVRRSRHVNLPVGVH